MMTRRQFLKAAGIGGLSLMAPPLLWKNEVQAAVEFFQSSLFHVRV
jgi:hypothetical protein